MIASTTALSQHLLLNQNLHYTLVNPDQIIESMQQEGLLEAISTAQNEFIKQSDIRKIFDALLVQLLALTGSEYGYIGEVHHTKDKQPFLRTHAISNIAWNQETRDFYEQNAPTGLEFYNLDTLFGYVLKHEQVVISNDPANDPRAGGLPPGHPDLNSYLGIPFIAGGRLVGSAGISNRAGGFDESVVEFLKPFTATCANIILANRAKQDLERNERLKNDIISIISHEFRTPMTSINGTLSLLEGLHFDALPEKAKPLVKMANSNSKHMLRLLDDILDVKKIKSGEIHVQPEEFVLKDVIEKLIEEVIPAAEAKQVSLSYECPAHLKLVADQDRMEQILVNLLSNAIKFTTKAPVKLSVQDQGDLVVISCEDQGSGIPESELANIFGKFQQVGEVNTRSTRGVGLGLYIVKSLVEQHQGTIEVDSVVGQGTRFTLKLPKGWTAGSTNKN